MVDVRRALSSKAKNGCSYGVRVPLFVLSNALKKLFVPKSRTSGCMYKRTVLLCYVCLALRGRCGSSVNEKAITYFVCENNETKTVY
jgi:hypothetical protein